MFLQERKPLMWERVRATERFSFVNESKIVHVVMDEVVNLERVRSDQWYHELTQTDTGIDRVKLWSLQTGHLEEDDLLIFPMEDEEVSRRSTEWVCCQDLDDGPGQSPGNEAAGFWKSGNSSSLKRNAKIFL